MKPVHDRAEQAGSGLRSPKSGVAVNQIYRDTYFDGKNDRAVNRTIQIVEVLPGQVRAVTVTDIRGNPVNRKTRISLKTLASSYVLVNP